jgi:hypothetical protein
VDAGSPVPAKFTKGHNHEEMKTEESGSSYLLSLMKKKIEELELKIKSLGMMPGLIVYSKLISL